VKALVACNPNQETAMSVKATKRLEELLAASINAAGAHCGKKK
jgi:hypothetical protein